MKLVRDRVPEIIRHSGEEPLIVVAEDDLTFNSYLCEKLQEEVSEFTASRDPEELADILEVVIFLAKSAGLSMDQLEDIRARKAEQNGSFDKRIIWVHNVEGGSS